MTERYGILVPIDAHGVNRVTLESMVRLARHLNRSVLGLVLADPRLQQVAALPFTTEIFLQSGQERGLEKRYLGENDRSASQTRRWLDELASRDRVSLQFESAAGERLQSALSRDGDLDVFIPARPRWQLVSTSYLPQQHSPRRLGLVLTGTDEDTAVIAMAGALLTLQPTTQVYVYSLGEPSPAALDALSSTGARLCVQSNFRASAPELASLIQRSACDLLLIPRASIALDDRALLERALENAGSQLLLVG